MLGTALGWTSPALPAVACPSEDLVKHCIDENESRWIGSLLPIGALIASQVALYFLLYNGDLSN